MSVIIGGSTHFAGPIVGAALYKLLANQLARVSAHSMLYVGLAALAIALFFPKGVVGTLVASRAARRSMLVSLSATPRTQPVAEKGGRHLE